MLQSRQTQIPARRQQQATVYAAAYEFDERNVPATHSYALGRLTYCPKGRLTVDVAGRRIHVDPTHALWIPGCMEHLLHSRGTRVCAKVSESELSDLADLPRACGYR